MRARSLEGLTQEQLEQLQARVDGEASAPQTHDDATTREAAATLQELDALARATWGEGAAATEPSRAQGQESERLTESLDALSATLGALLADLKLAVQAQHLSAFESDSSDPRSFLRLQERQSRSVRTWLRGRQARLAQREDPLRALWERADQAEALLETCRAAAHRLDLLRRTSAPD